MSRRATGPGTAAVRAWLKRHLSPTRLAHSAAVARLAAELAGPAGVAPARARLAGWLHDSARELSLSALESLLTGYRGRWLDADLRRTPSLWHDIGAAVLARRRFGVRDPGLLRALALHSTGGPGMTALDKVLFVADYSEPTRTQPDAARIRRLARRDLDAAVTAVLRAKLAYLRRHGLSVHARALALARELGLKIRPTGRGRGCTRA